MAIEGRICPKNAIVVLSALQQDGLGNYRPFLYERRRISVA
jgi:hypothetical protein